MDITNIEVQLIKMKKLRELGVSNSALEELGTYLVNANNAAKKL